MARELAKAGAHVLIQAAEREASQADETKKVVEEAGARGTVLLAEVGALEASERLVEQAWEQAGALDAMVINPTVTGQGDSESEEIRWNAVMRERLKVPFFLAKHAGLRMARAGRGWLVIVVDRAREGSADAPAATVAQAGLITMTRALAKALPASVLVSAVVAGSSPSRRARRRAETDRADDLARMIRFLIAESPHHSGAIIDLDDDQGRGIRGQARGTRDQGTV